jgi:hypothetical protein
MDFAVFAEGKDPLLMEVKYADDAPSPAFAHFSSFFTAVRKIQLVKELPREKTSPWESRYETRCGGSRTCAFEPR